MIFGGVSIDEFCKTAYEKKLVGFSFPFQREHWLSRSLDGKVNGRISANVSESDSSRGYIGFYECELSTAETKSVSEILLKAAENWLKSKGVKTIYGPVNYSTWFSYRFLVNQESPLCSPLRFAWEPHQPSEYVQHWQDFGFVPAEHYHSKAYPKISGAMPKTEPRYQELWAKGFRTRSMDFKTHAERELRAVGRINHASFKESFLKEPLGAEAYAALYVPQFAGYLSENCFFILNSDGKEIGYFFLYDDQGYLVWKTIAVIPEYQGIGVSTFGIHHALIEAKARGVDQMISALIRKGAQSEVQLQKIFNLLWEHEYTVFQKEI